MNLDLTLNLSLNFSELSAIKKSGEINRQVMAALFEFAKPGVSLLELDGLSEKMIRQKNASPSFKGYNGFPASTCTNINSTLIHGIPTNYQLKEGDILTIDQGVFFDGYHSDHALTRVIGKPLAKQELFLKAGEKALEAAIFQAISGNRVGDISFAISQTIEYAGFFVVKDYVGHGVGKKIHQSPNIPCYGKAGTGSLLKENDTLAIEVMYTDLPTDLTIGKDGWTVETKSANIAALFEKTVLVRREGALVLT